MNIAYRGGFLCEGLKQLGHKVLPIPEGCETDINEKIQNLNEPIDLVLLELYADSVPLTGLAKCEYPIAAYCIDAPLNKFWLKDACKTADYVFIDHNSSEDGFVKAGIKSAWLPLCAQESYFVDHVKYKTFDISFVGVVDNNRVKRRNIINKIQKNFNINIINNISLLEAQKIFSQSKITLNENMFNGLTLRMFQVFAAGSLLLTENASLASNPYFRDGEHLVGYDHNNIVDRIGDIISCYPKFQQIADYGKQECSSKHTSMSRAKDLLTAIESEKKKNARLPLTEREWYELKARYLSTLRYGGMLNGIINEFKIVSANASNHAGEALIKLGNIFARNNNPALAKQYYIKSISLQNNHIAWLKLAQLYIATDNLPQAKYALEKATAILPPGKSDFTAASANGMGQLLFMIAQIYSKIGQTFDLGFKKSFKDIVPDTAFEIAQMAYKQTSSPAILDFMLNCLRPYGIEGELLPLLLTAIKNGQLSDRHILRTAEIAASYYDTDTADMIITAFKRSK